MGLGCSTTSRWSNLCKAGLRKIISVVKSPAFKYFLSPMSLQVDSVFLYNSPTKGILTARQSKTAINWGLLPNRGASRAPVSAPVGSFHARLDSQEAFRHELQSRFWLEGSYLGWTSKVYSLAEPSLVLFSMVCYSMYELTNLLGNQAIPQVNVAAYGSVQIRGPSIDSQIVWLLL